jgi:uncharacterized membrane protein YdjX (TVP38/TMEM64 family)
MSFQGSEYICGKTYIMLVMLLPIFSLVFLKMYAATSVRWWTMSVSTTYTIIRND